MSFILRRIGRRRPRNGPLDDSISSERLRLTMFDVSQFLSANVVRLLSHIRFSELWATSRRPLPTLGMSFFVIHIFGRRETQHRTFR